MPPNDSTLNENATENMSRKSLHQNGDIELNLQGIQRLGPRTLMANLMRSDGQPLIHNSGDYVTFKHDAFCEKWELSLPIASYPSQLKDGAIEVLFYLDYGSMLNDLIYTPNAGFGVTLTHVRSGFDVSKLSSKSQYLCIAEGPGIAFFSSLLPSLIRCCSAHVVQFTPENGEAFFDNLFSAHATTANNFIYSKIIHPSVGSGVPYVIPKQFVDLMGQVSDREVDVQILIAGTSTFIASIKRVLSNRNLKHFSSHALICTDIQVLPADTEVSHDD